MSRMLRDETIEAWPRGTIPYLIHPRLDSARILEAMSVWAEGAKPVELTFVERTTETDFVVFEVAPDNTADLGFQGDRQTVELRSNASLGTILHEVGHLLGLEHEHTRHDRGEHITLHLEEAKTLDDRAELARIRERFDDELAYDLGSIMHYPADALARGELPTISVKGALPPGVVLGQREAPSARDFASVRLLYG